MAIVVPVFQDLLITEGLSQQQGLPFPAQGSASLPATACRWAKMAYAMASSLLPGAVDSRRCTACSDEAIVGTLSCQPLEKGLIAQSDTLASRFLELGPDVDRLPLRCECRWQVIGGHRCPSVSFEQLGSGPLVEMAFQRDGGR